MSMTIHNRLPEPEILKMEYPLSPELVALKKERDAEIKKVFTGESDKFLVIIGPCSADNEDSVCEYVSRLAKVNDEVKDRLILIPRIYTNKPRTTGAGYKGMLHQPDPTQEPDLYKGIVMIRKMHIRAMNESGLTAADEMLYPENRSYLDDILSYEAVGARSVENQQHRLTASGMDIPVGMKNPTSGENSIMFNSIIAAQSPHKFIYRGWEAQTKGNMLTHAILRGYVDSNGLNIPNYHYENLIRVYEEYMSHDLENLAVVIDTNHSNSGKKPLEQVRIAHEIMDSKRYNPDIDRMVKGMMIESYIEDGCQKIGEGIYGKSITDPCLGWEKSERLIYDIAESL